MRLIDKDKLLEQFNSGALLFQPRIREIIENQETIEAEPVVRCKDCTNFMPGKDEWGSCFENPTKMWRDTDYCSWAERRTDE